MVEPLSGARAEAFPGTAPAREPLAWFDSVEAGSGEGASWLGYDATLAVVRPGPMEENPPRTRAVLHLLDGDFGLDETDLKIERGDSLRMVSAGAHSANRGPRGAIGITGRHLWGAAGAARAGGHRLEARFAQRGAASSLAGGEEQSLRGESGRLEYRWRREGLHALLSAARGVGSGESFLPGVDLDTGSRRDAQRNEIALEAGAARADQDLGLRVAWSESRVARSPVFAASARTLWVAGRLARPAGEGVLELGLGAGHHDAFSGWDFAPAAAYRFAGDPFYGRVVIERLLAPVWVDLRPGQAPFLQSTWVAGCELGVASAAGFAAEVGASFGSCRNRAVVRRLPLEEQWLRDGFALDAGRYDFGLLTADAHWRRWMLAASATGFALARDRSAAQPAVDPGFGGRAALELRFDAFQKELGVAIGPEVEGVGPRESEAVVPLRIEGYASLGIAGTFTLGEAMLTVRARNLEDRARPETWIDSATGREAIGVGREVRIGFAWKLFN